MQALLRRDEAAALLGLSVNTLKRMEGRGDLRVVRFGTSVRIHPDEIERLRGGVTPPVSPTPTREGRHLSAQALDGELRHVFAGECLWRPGVYVEDVPSHQRSAPGARRAASTGGAGRSRSAPRRHTKTAHQRGER